MIKTKNIFTIKHTGECIRVQRCFPFNDRDRHFVAEGTMNRLIYCNIVNLFPVVAIVGA